MESNEEMAVVYPAYIQKGLHYILQSPSHTKGRKVGCFGWVASSLFQLTVPPLGAPFSLLFFCLPLSSPPPPPFYLLPSLSPIRHPFPKTCLFPFVCGSQKKKERASKKKKEAESGKSNLARIIIFLVPTYVDPC